MKNNCLNLNKQIIILIIVLLLNFFIIKIYFNNKATILEDEIIQENIFESNNFALMLEQSDGTYQESASNSWPSNMVFNSELSGCIDIDENKMSNVLSYDKNNNAVEIIVDAKIGLMYTSDYVLSLGSSSLSYKSSSNLSTLKTGWIHISNNDLEILSGCEWTMSRYGNIYGYYGALVVRSDGAVDKNGVVNSGAVRPVFYLESIVELADGVGTITDPFLIKLNGG